MNKNTFQIAIALMVLCMAHIGCGKEFLEEKPSTAILQPSSLEEFQSLLDNFEVMNVSTSLGVLAGDEYVFVSDAIWQSARTTTERNSYVWAKDLYEGEISEDWNQPYRAIFYANNILEGIKKIPVTSSNAKTHGNIHGWALFVRAFAYFELVNNFAPTYNSLSSKTDLGVPLRLYPSVDELLPRASVQSCFDRILDDLNEASRLLDTAIPTDNRNRPSKIACFALLARIYLQMGNYEKAEYFAGQALQISDKLMDYKSLNRSSANPFPQNNDELIYAKLGTTKAAYSAAGTFTQISDELLNLYAPNDLRKLIFFNKKADGNYNIKRGYHGLTSQPFIGLAVDELYLIKAECLARRQEIGTAMDLLNQLLKKRWDANLTIPAVPYQNLVASTSKAALDLVLLERRKELVWRGIRWDDLKRLNRDGANIVLSRSVLGHHYTIAPNSPKYIFPIPDNEIALSGIPQNNR